MSTLRGALAAVIAISGCAHRLCDPQPKGWKTVRSEHFIVYTDAGALRTSSIVERLENKHAAFTAFFPGKLDLREVEVVLFDDYTEYGNYMGWRWGGSCAAGGSKQRKEGLIILRADTDEDVFAHQLAHRFVHVKAPKAPLWIHEGIAAYLQTTVNVDGVARTGYQPGETTAAWKGQLIPLQKLFASQRPDFSGGEGWRHFDTAWAFVAFVLHGRDGAMRGGLFRFLHNLDEGQDADTAFAAAFPGTSLAEVQDHFEEDYRLRAFGTWQTLQFATQPTSDSTTATPSDPDDIRSLCASMPDIGAAAGQELYPDWFEGGTGRPSPGPKSTSSPPGSAPR